MIKSSCVLGEPFVRLGEGKAPVLEYNIPQSTCFSTYGNVAQSVNVKLFFPAEYQSSQQPLNVISQTDVTKLRAELLEATDLIPRLQLLDLVQGTRVMRERAVLPGVLTPPIVPARGVRVVHMRGDLPPSITGPAQVSQLDETTERILHVLSKGEIPVASRSFGGEIQIQGMETSRPGLPLTPMFHAIEEYEVCSYLGNYGAGKTVRTFTLLPGEKTTISVRTYREQTDTASRSENILDSFSETAADEFESTLQDESGSSASASGSITDSRSGGLSLTAGGKFKGIDLGGTASATTSHTQTSAYTRDNYAKQISSAVAKHVTTTNASREIEVNVSTTSTVTTGEETTTTRVLENINRSRVLNFVFRQLLQEYFTIIYLKDVRFLYTNGDPRRTRLVDICELEDFLTTVILPDHVPEVLASLLKPYCVVYNHEGERKNFIEKVVETLGDCPFAAPEETITFYRKSMKLSDGYHGVRVDGVILRVLDSVVRTSSLIVDALLGQGEALDCYNQCMQEASVEKAQLDNKQREQALASLLEVTNPVARADAYAKVFGTCCDQVESATTVT